jgi:orotate phosphoribosyltransferase
LRRTAPQHEDPEMTRASDPARAQLAADVAAAALLHGDFVLSSGRRSSYYLDKYRFETDPALLRRIATGLGSLLDPGVTRLAGPELGAVALVTALALETGLPFVIVRRAAKDHGGSREIEGLLEAGDVVAIVEDVITTGGQALAAAERIEAAGGRVVQVLGVVDREEGGAEAIAQAGYPFRALFTRADLQG